MPSQMSDLLSSSRIQILQQREACHTQHLSQSGVIWRRNMPGWKRCLSHRVWMMRSESHGHPIMQCRRGASHLKWALHNCCLCFENRLTPLQPLNIPWRRFGTQWPSSIQVRPSHSCCAATVLSIKTNPMGVARVWRGQVCHNVWGTPYRNGSIEVTRNSTRRQWMD